MTSEPIRDPRGDHLLTPRNCALVIIDYQPTQVTSIRSMDQDQQQGQAEPDDNGVQQRACIIVPQALDRARLGSGGSPGSVDDLSPSGGQPRPVAPRGVPRLARCKG